MKLYPLLFLNEIAKSAGVALDKRLAALDASEDQNFRRIILFIPFSLEEAVKKTLQNAVIPKRNVEATTHSTDLPPPPSNPPMALESTDKEIMDLLGIDTNRANKDAIKYQIISGKNRAIIAHLTYKLKENESGLAEINTSAAIGGFGPLIYQIAMYQHPDLWLTSDSSLKPASKRVWNKMYELSKQGVYERKFVGEINAFELKRKKFIDKALSDYFDGILNGTTPPTEKALLDWLVFNDLDANEYGYLWAYKKLDHDPKIKELFNRGEKAVQDISNKYKIPTETLVDVLRMAGRELFSKLYGSEASYAEE
jgi:hypothetical protein